MRGPPGACGSQQISQIPAYTPNVFVLIYCTHSNQNIRTFGQRSVFHVSLESIPDYKVGLKKKQKCLDVELIVKHFVS
jgi:hypothetical protein